MLAIALIHTGVWKVSKVIRVHYIGKHYTSSLQIKVSKSLLNKHYQSQDISNGISCNEFITQQYSGSLSLCQNLNSPVAGVLIWKMTKSQ